MSSSYPRLSGKLIHRIKAEEAIGRPLVGDECVHHVDLDKNNYDNTNLVICPNPEYHFLLHVRTKILDLGGNPNKEKYCGGCEELHSKDSFNKRSSNYDGLQNQCREYTSWYKSIKGFNKRSRNWKDNLSQQYRRIFDGTTKLEFCKL